MCASTGSGGNRDTTFAVKVDHAFVVVPKNIPVAKTEEESASGLPFSRQLPNFFLLSSSSLLVSLKVFFSVSKPIRNAMEILSSRLH